MKLHCGRMYPPNMNDATIVKVPEHDAKWCVLVIAARNRKIDIDV